MLLYDRFTIALRYSVKLPFSQFARVAYNLYRKSKNMKCEDNDILMYNGERYTCSEIFI